MAPSPALTSFPSLIPSSPPPPRRCSNLQPIINNNNKKTTTAKISELAALTTSIAQAPSLSSAVSTFSLMLSSSPNSSSYPSHITLLTLLSSPHHHSSLRLALSLHSLILKLYHPPPLTDPLIHLQLHTALLSLYSKCGRPDLARQLFDRMPAKNSVTFNSMLAAHMRNGQPSLALSLFRQIPPELRDKVSWTALIDGLVKNSLLDEAMSHFIQMQKLEHKCKIDPDYVLIVSLVSACADLGALALGMWVHQYAMRRGLCGNVRVLNSFIDMYARCGRVDLASQVFDRIERSKRTRVTWNSMIVGFAINGCSREAIDCFERMQGMGFEPDGVSITGALTACSHAGLVDEGIRYYRLMQRRYENIPMRIEHYGCVVDLLGRAGRLEEAMGLVDSMMPVMGPNEVVLGSLLASCRMHGNVELAEKLMSYLVELEPETDSNFVLLSNIYADAGRWDGVGKVRNMMKSLGIRKSPGFSAVEIDGDFHEFVSGDKGHTHSENIHGMLELLEFEMKLHHHHTWL